MKNSYLRSFVIASSIIVILPHLLTVANLDDKNINYSYKQYSFVAPLYYGFMNMLSLYIALKFNLSSRERYLLIGSISPIIVFIYSYSTKAYNFHGDQWLKYGVILFFMHFFIWNVLVYSLDKYV